MSNKPSFIVFDIETTGLVPGVARIHGLSLQAEGEANPRPYALFTEIPTEYVELLRDPEILKVGHNVRFDIKHLRANGVKVEGPLFCTMNAAYVLNENQRIALDDLTEKYLGPGRLSAYEALRSYYEARGMRHVGQLCELDLLTTEEAQREPYRDLLYAYGVEDVRNTFDLYPILQAKIRELSDVLRSRYTCTLTPEDYLRDEIMPTEEALCDLELRGIRVDEARVVETQRRVADEKGRLTQAMLGQVGASIRPIEEALYAQEISKLKKAEAIARREPGKGKAKFNFSSNDHLAALLYKQLGLGPHMTRDGNLSVDDKALQACAAQAKEPHVKEFISTLQAYRNNSKNLTTYIGNSARGFLSLVRGVEGSRRFYPTYDSRIVTGRLGSFAHTFPRDFDITRALVPDEGHLFVYFDYAAVELRIAAHLSGDEVMLSWFNDGVDPHCDTASKLFGRMIEKGDPLRQVGKRANFLLIYKGNPWSLQEALREECNLDYSDNECIRFSEIFWKSHPQYKEFTDGILRSASRNGFVTAENGRIRRLPDIGYGRALRWDKDNSGRWQASWVGTHEQAHLLGGGTPAQLAEKAKRAYSHAKKQAINFPIQTMGATFTKRACIEARRRGYDLAYTKHDCAIFQVRADKIDEARVELKSIAESVWPSMRVPLVAEFKVLQSINEGDVLDTKGKKAA